MISGIDRLRRTAAPGALGLCAIGLLVGANAAMAGDDASRWDGDARSAVRLIAGAAPADKTAPMRAGIEIRLKPGWHTYWRYPGDAGVPPRFDFTGSQNVKSVTVLWPAPQRIPEQGLIVIGYGSDVVLPLVVVPQNRAKPVTLRLKLDYAVCEKLCVPAEGKAELALAGTRSSLDSTLAAAEARVPKKLTLGEGSTFAVKSVRRIVHERPAAREDGRERPAAREDGRERPGAREDGRERPAAGGASRPRVIVDVAAPAGAGITLFAEGPTADWALPVPAAVDGAPAGLQRFAFDLDGAPPGANYEGISITLTAVAGDKAVEVVTRLD